MKREASGELREHGFIKPVNGTAGVLYELANVPDVEPEVNWHVRRRRFRIRVGPAHLGCR